jgi:pyruvate, water dikinase
VSLKSLADVIAFADLPADSVAIAGGKGASLARMSHAGLPVPAGFVISAHAFHNFLDAVGGIDVIRQVTDTLDVHDSAAVEEAATRIRGLITDSPMPAALAAAISSAYQSLAGSGPVAVRSSAVSEDGSAASFAGQQETFLNIRGADNVLVHVQECWASFYSPRAMFYRAQKAVLFDTRMAVVVQQMVDAEKSGVIFTVDPIRNRRECLIIEAAPGLGEGIVSGEVTPDHYVVSRDGWEIVDEFIPSDRSERVLDEGELRQLRDLGLKLEAFFGSPQDVEWCVRAGDLRLLQSRPITTLPVHG